MIDIIMFGIILTGIALWAGYEAYQAYLRHQWRVTDRQIDAGEVPRNYSKVVRERATKMNNAILTTLGDHPRALGLSSIRIRVARIRVEGFDRARLAKEREEPFITGIESNPYPKGSGEAQQWARGFCQEGGHPPKGWMAIA